MQILPATMLSLPISTIDPASSEDQKSLLHAFHSFTHAAGSLEHSYGALRAEVERLHRELEDTQGKLRREQALAELSTVLAHEIRNPLASLELFAGLLAEAELDPECLQWVEHIQAGLRTLSATVNNVLHFHAVPRPECAPVDLGQLLEWARDFFGPLARRSQVRVALENSVTGFRFPADRHCLEQVLLNLMLNAVRAMPEGGGWITLRGRTSLENKIVLLEVVDTGRGIPPEDLPHIFDPGFSTRAGGAGLGLAVCRTIVEQHGGSVSATTVPGYGSTFRLTFPLPANATEGASA